MGCIGLGCIQTPCACAFDKGGEGGVGVEPGFAKGCVTNRAGSSWRCCVVCVESDALSAEGVTATSDGGLSEKR